MTDYRAALFNMALNHRRNPYANALDGTADVLEGASRAFADLEAENKRLREALGNAGCVYCNSSKRLDVLGDPTVGVSLSPDPASAALSQEEKP